MEECGRKCLNQWISIIGIEGDDPDKPVILAAHGPEVSKEGILVFGGVPVALQEGEIGVSERVGDGKAVVIIPLFKK